MRLPFLLSASQLTTAFALIVVSVSSAISLWSGLGELGLAAKARPHDAKVRAAVEEFESVFYAKPATQTRSGASSHTGQGGTASTDSIPKPILGYMLLQLYEAHIYGSFCASRSLSFTEDDLDHLKEAIVSLEARIADEGVVSESYATAKAQMEPMVVQATASQQVDVMMTCAEVLQRVAAQIARPVDPVPETRPF